MSVGSKIMLLKECSRVWRKIFCDDGGSRREPVACVHGAGDTAE